MNKRLLPSLFLVLAAGCSNGTPTGSDRSMPSGPALDGGVMHGSGNRSDSTGTNTSAATTGGVAAVESERTGVMHGSGN